MPRVLVASGGRPPVGSRLHYMDNARAVASVLGIFYHSALVFSAAWIVSVPPADRSGGLAMFATVCEHFRMPIFLLIAGYFTGYALRTRGSAEFLRHRALRIGLPLVVSILTLLQFEGAIYLHGAASQARHARLHDLASPEFSLSHLWFLYYLVLYSLLVVAARPLLRRAPTHALRRALRALHARGSASVLALWIGLNFATSMAGVAWQDHLPVHRAWLPMAELMNLLPLFVFGVICFQDREMMNRLWVASLGRSLGLVALGTVGAAVVARVGVQGTRHMLLSICARWILTVGALSLLRTLLDRSNRFLRYLSEASYPVYLFHSPVIVGLATFYVGSGAHLPVAVAYPLLVAAAAIVTYTAYEVVVRRSAIGALLFTGQRRAAAVPVLTPLVTGAGLAATVDAAALPLEPRLRD